MSSVSKNRVAVLRDRDLFFHDGQHLRRVRLSLKVQLAFAMLAALLLGWSGFATARYFLPSQPPIPHDIASLAAATEVRAQQIEARQQLLAQMLAGAEVDPALLEAHPVALPKEIADALSEADSATLDAAARTARTLEVRYNTSAAELARLGVDATRVAGASGGPYEPATGGNATFSELFKSWKKLDNLANGAIAVPSEKPVADARFTSGFGNRSDPFNGRSARHQGIDLAGAIGTPILATADGTVMRAGWNDSGYGNLVELGHGKGITTRYGHMSKIKVAAGQSVRRGEVIGYMGSTGRSTGSHLHYEVRIDGRAVNPIPFMKSNDYLLAMQKAGPHSMEALGGGR